ncbi:MULTISPECIES: MBL fold metallo-hydrolase [Methylobacterium]|uniref:MBL fold metallo-hydrolase n=1 Tax=Methylobacterium TaxID=407 RepID=UPI0005BC33E8|nr:MULTISPECIES: MBL fold metallo-hydrolase [Methylobacterium]MDH3030138.1 MBL fold metallo-hydrolase [Methylobacterium fujisawaense]SFV08841.1 ribonuclease J [Methylobacterium sp. UNCCL125]
MRVRIHRGTREIGGTCVELEHGGAHLLLDLGLPLDAEPDDASRHPAIEGLAGGGNLLALLLSHGHRDHVGLAHLAGPDLPVAMGAATLRILKAAAAFVPDTHVPANAITFTEGHTLTFGPFTVTPRLVDHSAYDAYALLVEAGGQRLLYSGDLRAHGRKGALFERLVRDPPRGIDTLLLEGSSLGRLEDDRTFPTEAEIETRFVGLFEDTAGLALVAASAQNIDRVVSLYRACKRTGRTLVLDLYAAEVLAATGNPRVPQSDWPGVAIFVPHHQRVWVKRTGRFDLIERHGANRIYAEQLATLAPRAALLFRHSLLPDLDRAGCLAGAQAIWSQWAGYLDQPRGQALAADLAERGIPLAHAHTSGHAGIPDLKRLAAATAPRQLVPVHTFMPERFPALFGANVTIREDGQWWETAA